MQVDCVITCFRNGSGWVLRVLFIRKHISLLLIKLALLQRLSLVHSREQDANESDVISVKRVSSKRIELFTVSKTACSDCSALVLIV